jgi:DMSO reductase family type II enzyme chaperone
MTTATPEAIEATSAARFTIYQLLTDALEFPTPAFHEQVRSGAFRDDVRRAMDALPFSIDEGRTADGLMTDDSYLDFQAEYIRLFDVGVVRPPCPLYGGEWGRARRSTMEDALRFYEFFGVKMNEQAHELPDHVTVELEFMQVLAYTEGSTRARNLDALPFVRAQRDFLARHLGKWWPLLRRKVVSQQPSAFYEAVTALADAFFTADARRMRSLAEGAA